VQRGRRSHEETSRTRGHCHDSSQGGGQRLLELLPDDLSLEDIQYHIDARQKIERGLEDIEAGRTISEAEFEAKMSKWLEP